MRDFFSRTSPDGDDAPVDLDQVRADDAFIEALRQDTLFPDAAVAPTRWLRAVDDTAVDTASAADDRDAGDGDFEAFVRLARAPMPLRDPGTAAADAQVAAMLQAWRHEIDAVPLPPPLDTQIAAAIIRSAPSRRRSVRPMIAVAAAIAGLLMGSTAIGARSASPDDTLLWPVTQLLWGDRVEEVQASIDARKGIDSASKAIDAGHPDQAEAALDHVTVVITRVQDPSELATLKSDLGIVQSQLESSRATSSSNPPAASTPTASGAATTVPTVTSTPPTTAPSVPVVPPADDPVPPVAPSSEVELPPAGSVDAPSSSEPETPAETSTPDETSAEPTAPATPTEDTTTASTPAVDEPPSPSGVLPDAEPAGGELSAQEQPAG